MAMALLNVKLAKTLTGLDSVTAGNTKIDNGGLTVGGKTYVSPTGINANDQKVTNVADGTVALMMQLTMDNYKSLSAVQPKHPL